MKYIWAVGTLSTKGLPKRCNKKAPALGGGAR